MNLTFGCEAEGFHPICAKKINTTTIEAGPGWTKLTAKMTWKVAGIVPSSFPCRAGICIVNIIVVISKNLPRLKKAIVYESSQREMLTFINSACS
jgi:hypothetical protein